MVDLEERAGILWKEFGRTHSLESRNGLVMHYLPLVKSIVYRMAPTYRKHVDFDDLMSCGLLGLMDAVDKFDPDKEVKFETYAALRVRGEIIDQIRKQDWAPISLRQKIRRVETGFQELENKLGRSVSEDEVAAHLAVSAEEVRRTLDESHTFNLVSMDEMISDRVKGDEMPVSLEALPEEAYEKKEMRELLAGFIDLLPERERMVVSLYYYDELTLKEIGLTLGVTESRVSQIHSKALLFLRNKMKSALRV